VAEEVAARFRVGDRVTVRAAYPLGHVRTPHYIRGKSGVIERLCGAYPNPEELAYARGRIVVATRAAGLVAPVDGPYPDLDDLEGLLAGSRRLRTLGFQGRVALHPAQVTPINRAFSELGDDEAAHARRVVEAFEAAAAAGIASLRVDGRFVDQPVYELARRKLSHFEALKPPGSSRPLT